jgi:hypothetical protein
VSDCGLSERRGEDWQTAQARQQQAQLAAKDVCVETGAVEEDRVCASLSDGRWVQGALCYFDGKTCKGVIPTKTMTGAKAVEDSWGNKVPRNRQ